MMRNLLFPILSVCLFGSCNVNSGPKFYNCTSEEDANLAVDIVLGTMDGAPEIVQRLDVFCKDRRPYPKTECYVGRYGNDLDRAAIYVHDMYVGECIIHEMYHADLAVLRGYSCNEHSEECGWNWDYLEERLDMYQDLRKK